MFIYLFGLLVLMISNIGAMKSDIVEFDLRNCEWDICNQARKDGTGENVFYYQSIKNEGDYKWFKSQIHRMYSKEKFESVKINVDSRSEWLLNNTLKLLGFKDKGNGLYVKRSDADKRNDRRRKKNILGDDGHFAIIVMKRCIKNQAYLPFLDKKYVQKSKNDIVQLHEDGLLKSILKNLGIEQEYIFNKTARNSVWNYLS